MVKKKIIRQKIKTLSGGYTSKLETNYAYSSIKAISQEDINNFYNDVIKSTKNEITNPYESLDAAIFNEINFVQGFLKKHGIPYNHLIEYEVVYDYQSDFIQINGQFFNASFEPEFENRMPAFTDVKMVERTNLEGLLIDWFSHIPACISIANFYTCLSDLYRFKDENNIDKCAAKAMEAVSYTKDILIATFEDYEFFEESKKKASNQRDLYIVNRWEELQSEGCNKGSASEIIALELNEKGYKTGTSTSGIREKLKAGKLSALKKKLNI